MKTARVFRWVCVLLVLGAARLWAADPSPVPSDGGPATNYDLRYKFRRGDTLRTETLHRAAVDTTVAGTSQTAQTVSKSIKVWKVLGVAENGDITIEYSVESANMRQKMSGRAEITYDSSADAEPPAEYEEVAKSIGVPLTVVTIDPHGKMLNREDKRSRPSVEQSNQMVLPLPATPVSIGYSWTVPQDLDVAADGGTRRIQCRQRFELTSVKNGIATIELESQLITPTEDPKIRAQLAQRMSKGTIRFDLDAGRVISQEMKWDERVIGFSGPDSSLRYLAEYKEQALRNTAKTAARPVLQD